MKKCRDCKQTLDLSQFYKHNKMLDGHLNKCKSCVKSRVSKHREQNVERIREYDRQRGVLPHRKENARRSTKRYASKYPWRVQANGFISRAIRDNRMVKGPCEICGVAKVTGHHDDYRFPFSVRWLCQAHHKQWHSQNEPIDPDVCEVIGT